MKPLRYSTSNSQIKIVLLESSTILKVFYPELLGGLYTPLLADADVIICTKMLLFNNNDLDSFFARDVTFYVVPLINEVLDYSKTQQL